jgi:hypothetical protein
MSSFYNSGRAEERPPPQTVRLSLHLLVVMDACSSSATEMCVNSVVILQDYLLPWKCVSKPLYSNGWFVLLNYSGFQLSCHSMFTRACQWTLCSHPVSLRSIHCFPLVYALNFKWYFPFRLSDESIAWIPIPPVHTTCLNHLSLCDLVTLILLYLVRSKVKKLLIMQSSPTFCHFVPLTSKYWITPSFQIPSISFLPWGWETTFIPIQNKM